MGDSVQLFVKFCFGIVAILCLGFGRDMEAHPAHAKPVNYPFVVGFERFHSSVDNADHLAEGGFLLLNELNCVACHAPPESLANQLIGVTATNLEGTASRLSHVDLELMIRNPRFVKQDTMMPSLFAGPDRKLEEVEALKHYLSTFEVTEKIEYPIGDIEKGRRLYHRIGCVGCHAPEVGYRPEGLPDGIEVELTGLPSVPMNLADRYDLHSLTRFLLDPISHRPSGRMPDYQFSEVEAADLAAYLKAGPDLKLPENLSNALDAETPFQTDSEKVELGRQVFVKKNCHACHSMNDIDSEPTRAKPLLQLDFSERKGCFSERPVGGAVPHYGLDEVQIKAITEALKRLPQRQVPDQAGEIDWTLSTLNCYACHERDGKGGTETAREIYFAVNDVGALSLGRWGNIPPRLDHVGRKLTDQWFSRVLLGEGDEGKARPYMEARMPLFRKKDTLPLVEKFRAADQLPEPVEIDTSGLAKHHRSHFGRELIGINGLGCVNCHGLNGKKSLGAPVIDLTNTVHRLQPGYFKELLLDPQGTQPGTLMPPVFADRKNADREIEQLWTYLKEIDQQPLPDGLLTDEDYELDPKTEGKPIVFRSFMENVGSHAIAVGFPEGLHAAFDSKGCRWRLAWKGKFLDAMSTWEDRFCEPAKILGEEVKEIDWKIPEQAEFEGFVLDAKGVPTFLYQVDGKKWQDRVAPVDGKLKRILIIDGEKQKGEELAW